MINTVIQRDADGAIASIFQWADTRGTWRMVESFKRYAGRVERPCVGCGAVIPGEVQDCAGDATHYSSSRYGLVGFFSSSPDVNGHTISWHQSQTEDLEDAIDNGVLVSMFAVSDGRIVHLAPGAVVSQ